LGSQPWLYIVLLGLVFIWFARFIPKSPSSAAISKELEQTIDAFTAEMDEENKELLQNVTAMKQEHDQKLVGLNHRIEMLEKQNYDLSQELKRFLEDRKRESVLPYAGQEAQPPRAAEPPAGRTGTPNDAKPVVEEESEKANEPAAASIMGRYSELFQLHDQGKSVEYIAKKLGMNKGEVQLILQLAKQEESNRV
jgi:histone deacetylase complex regulatory component SIN3